MQTIRTVAFAVCVGTVAHAACLGAQPNFLPQQVYGLGAQPVNIIAGDFNNDGYQDLATANIGGTGDCISVLYGSATGAFGPRTDMYGFDSPYGLASADFDGDGCWDLAMTSHAWGGEATVLYGNPAGGFPSQRRVEQLATSERHHDVTTEDFNKDGYADLAFEVHNDLPSSPCRITVLYGSASGAFGGDGVPHAVAKHPSDITVCDLNGDGWKDLAVASNWAKVLSVLYGSPSGYGSACTLDVACEGHYLASGCFDDDSLDDLAVSHMTAGVNISVLYSSGGGTAFAAGNKPHGIAAADFDGDGRLDLAVANAQDENVTLFYGLSGGRFGQGENYQVGGWPGDLIAADLNGDGWPDLAVGNHGGFSVTVLYNTLPEPATLALVAAGGLLAVRRRRAP